MDSNDFKKIFDEIAKLNGFEKAYEGWFKEFPEVILVLDLQKSNYSNLYHLNIKLFIQGLFGDNYIKNKKMVKTETGDVFLRQPDNYSSLLDLDIPLQDHERKEGLINMFDDFIMPFTNKVNSRESVRNLYKSGNLYILPAVKKELGIC